MKSASMSEVKHELSRVLAWVNAGETVTISRGGVTVAKLVPITNSRVKKRKASPKLPTSRGKKTPSS